MAFVFLDKRNILIGSLILALIFSLGVIIGYYGHQVPEPSVSKADALVHKIMKDQFLNEKELIREALKNVDTNSLRSYHEELTKEPHIAGQRRDEVLTKYIQKAWTQMGFDRVELAEYDFYLSWPNQVLFVTFFKITYFKE